MRSAERKEKIINQLRSQGCRITKQRRILLDVILDENCTSCKEIYYRAARIDHSIGIATVYRTVNKLEEIGVISRGKIYTLSDFPKSSAQGV